MRNQHAWIKRGIIHLWENGEYTCVASCMGINFFEIIYTL